MEDKCGFFINAQLATHEMAKEGMYKQLLDDHVQSFHKSLNNYKESPLVSLPGLAESLDIGSILVKDESTRLGLNSFKILGVSYAVHEILKQKKGKSTVLATATEGNHGKALARTALLAGSQAVIFVPQTIDLAIVKSIEEEQAIVEIVQGDYDEAVRMAAAQSEKNNWTLIQDTSFENYKDIPLAIMAGYTTIFKEIGRQLLDRNERADLIFLQAGVGSFAAAAVYYYTSLLGSDKPKIVIVEPALADGCLQSAIHTERVQTKKQGKTLLTGLNCRTPSALAWPILRQGTDAFLSISDFYAELAVKCLAEPIRDDQKIMAGYSGAAGLAGLLAVNKAPELKELKAYLAINKSTNILIINTECYSIFPNKAEQVF